jgi:ABC-2 type transport system permease protein
MAEGGVFSGARDRDGANQAPTPVARLYGEINWIGLLTLTRREIMRFMKVPAQTVLAPLVSTILFMLVFLLAMGGAGRGATVPGGNYGAFLAPGLIMMGLLSNSFANSSSSLIGAKMQGNSVDFLMPPLSAAELTAAFIGGAAVRGILVGLASAVVAMPAANIAPQHWWAVFFFGGGAAIIFGALGLIGGIWAEKFDQLAVITNFIITPLTFLSGTFYSINRLPAPIAAFSHFNPVFLIIDGFRYGFIGHADSNLVVSTCVIGALAVSMTALCWLVLRSGWRMKA